MYKKLLITGANGWLGRGLSSSLVNKQIGHLWIKKLKGIPIKAMVLPEDAKIFKANFSEIEMVIGDLRNPLDCENFVKGESGACLIHIAGIIHPKRFVREFYELNVEASKNLLDASIKHALKRAVIMSSNSPIGCNRTVRDRFDESSPYNPYMHYGRSKMLLEQYISQISSQIETVIIRAPWFYGPFQPRRQIDFFEMIRKGKGPVVGNGNNVRSMAYIDNLIQGILLSAIEQRAAGHTFWIADKHPYTMNQVINTIEYLLAEEFNQDCNFGRLKLPNLFSEVAYFSDKLIQGMGLYHQKIHVLSELNKNIACDIDKARALLGYAPLIDLEEGMRRSLKELYL